MVLATNSIGLGASAHTFSPVTSPTTFSIAGQSVTVRPKPPAKKCSGLACLFQALSGLAGDARNAAQALAGITNAVNDAVDSGLNDVTALGSSLGSLLDEAESAMNSLSTGMSDAANGLGHELADLSTDGTELQKEAVGVFQRGWLQLPNNMNFPTLMRTLYNNLKQGGPEAQLAKNIFRKYFSKRVAAVTAGGIAIGIVGWMDNKPFIDIANYNFTNVSVPAVASQSSSATIKPGVGATNSQPGTPPGPTTTGTDEPKKIYGFETQIGVTNEEFDQFRLTLKLPPGQSFYYSSSQAWYGEITDAEAAEVRSHKDIVFGCDLLQTIDLTDYWTSNGGDRSNSLSESERADVPHLKRADNPYTPNILLREHSYSHLRQLSQGRSQTGGIENIANDYVFPLSNGRDSHIFVLDSGFNIGHTVSLWAYILVFALTL